jgi:hypothetical protein
MLDAILDSAHGGDTGGYQRIRRRSGKGFDQPLNDLVGWIEEQGEEAT